MSGKSNYQLPYTITPVILNLVVQRYFPTSSSSSKPRG
jgi:hypothetical protein